MASFLIEHLGERTSCVKVKATLKVPVSLPTGHKVTPHRDAVKVVYNVVHNVEVVQTTQVVQTSLVFQTTRIVLPVDANVQRLPSVLANPLQAALQQHSVQGSLRRKQ